MKFKFFAFVLILSCFLTGCSHSTGNDKKVEPTGTPFKEPTSIENYEKPSKEDEMISISPIHEDPSNALPKDSLIKFIEGNISRITYDHNRSEAKIISEVQGLLPYKNIKELSKYNKDYFKDNSLLLITQTTTSGSIGVSVDGVASTDNVLKVKMKYDVPKMGTADMATWLLWIEISKDYDGFNCEIINPATTPGLSAY